MSHSPLGISTLGMISGSRTYLAGGATIDLAAPGSPIAIEAAAAVSLTTEGVEIDVSTPPATLDVTNDGNGIDL